MASDHPINVTLKAGTGYDAPWITVGGTNPDEVKAKLDALGTSGVLSSAVAAAHFFQATLTGQAGDLPMTPAAAAVTPPPAPQSVPTQQPNQQAAQPQTAWTNPPQQQQGFDGSPDPLGRVCGSCGQGVQGKEIRSKKNGNTYQLWVCPNQRNKDDGHFSEFVK